MTEDRQHTRTHVDLRPRYRVPTTFDYVEAPCGDLSLGGMFLEVSEPADLGTLVKIECDAGTGRGSIIGVGRVVWRRLKGSLEAPSGMGVKFVKLRGSSLRVISRVIDGTHGCEPGPVDARAGALELADRLGRARSHSAAVTSGVAIRPPATAGQISKGRDILLVIAGIAIGGLGWLVWSLIR